jgi:osmotically-inducible protein OsmY
MRVGGRGSRRAVDHAITVSYDDEAMNMKTLFTWSLVGTLVVSGVQASDPPAVTAPVVVMDHSVKAASIEVAWLQQPLTYPLRLRAECKPGDEGITITGYLPHERMREKVLNMARAQCGDIPLVDRLTVQPMMVLPTEIPVDGEQAFIVKVALERMSPGLSSGIDIQVDKAGVVTVTGRVDELNDRRKIIRGLQGIPGCTAVKYNLSVPAPSRQGMVQVVPSITISPVTQVEAKAPKTVVEPVVPPLDLKLPGEEKKPPVLLPKVEPKKPVKVETTVEKMISSSTQSGMFPPGVTGLSPVLDVSGITLSSPVISRALASSTPAEPVIQLVEAVEPEPRLHVTRPITISVMTQPVEEALPLEPEVIAVKPRKASIAQQRRVIP